MPIAFTKVKMEHGWLGNMAAFPVVYAGHEWRTTEHLFQALRFEDEAVRKEIRDNKSPMAAKMAAKKHKDKMTVVPQSEVDQAIMMLCLRLKIDQHPELRKLLLLTGDETIIEDCTSRPRGSGLFWGAAKQDDGSWKGENVLGKLWMTIRNEIKGEA
jgi:N-glycosidase YbiA